MKAVFNFVGPASRGAAAAALAGAVATSGCLGFEDPGAGAIEPTLVGDTTDAVPHGLHGEVMLIVNGRPSSRAGAYLSNIPAEVAGTYRGPSMYLYDPTRICDDGTTRCRIVELGAVALDDRLGQVSLDDDSLRRLVIYDVAWHPQRGLWGVTYDPFNDEWGVAQFDVPDWSSTHNTIGADRWVFRPGQQLSPSTDPCYWHEAVSGLSFLGDQLMLGVRGLGGVGLPSTAGMLYSVDLGVAALGHCQVPEDTSNDDNYYACASMCQRWSVFDEFVGISGDMVPSADGASLVSVVRPETSTAGVVTHTSLFTADPGAPGELATQVDMGVGVEVDSAAWPIDGAARVAGALYLVRSDGVVLKVDEQTGTSEVHDDLSASFSDAPASIKLRGATTVTLP